MSVFVQPLWSVQWDQFCGCHFHCGLRQSTNQPTQGFKGIAARGKGSTGWSFGFKLHLVVSNAGKLLAVYLTTAHPHELKALPKLVKRLFGKLFADLAYLS